MLRIEEVQTSKDVNNFFKFPIKLHQNDPNFVPQLNTEESSIFSLNKNDCFNFCDVYRYLVYDNKKVVGRFAIVINNRYNDTYNKKELRFTRLDLINDKYVFDIIYDKLREVANEHNIDTIIGPFGFSTMDYNGLLIDGFEKMGTCFSNCCNEYVMNYLLDNKFVIDEELSMLELDIRSYDDPRYNMMENYLLKNYGLEIVKPDNDNKLLQMISESMELSNEINETHLSEYHYLSFTKKQIHDLSAFLMELTNYDYTVGVYKDGKMIGFALAIPGLARALQKSKGSIGPITSIKLRNALKQNLIIDFPILNVSRKYKDLGIESLLFINLLRKFKDNGVKKIYTKPVNVKEFPIEILNGYTFKEYKRFGIFKISK